MRQGLAVQPEAGEGGQRQLVSPSCEMEAKGHSSSSWGKGSPSAHLAESNGFQGREGHVQGVMTFITFVPALGQGHPESGAPSSVWEGPGAGQTPSTPSKRQEGEGVILFKIHVLIYKCIG